FRFVEGDIRSLDACRGACAGVEVVLHQAALGSVPRSIEDPLSTHAANVTGFVNMAIAARDASVARFVYASSSAVYGDHPVLPKLEERIGAAASPYGLSTHLDELYAGIFSRCYGFPSLGLRYFNVFGPRQDPDGPYAAVIPKWIGALLEDEPVEIYGDGETSRDFCYVANAVQANLLAGTTGNPEAVGGVFNVAVGQRTTLNELFRLIRDRLAERRPEIGRHEPTYADFRPGDVRHSLASVEEARERLGFHPTHGVEEGLDETVAWFADRLPGRTDTAGRALDEV
ncbi:MAG: NAD-dependent epimerase/dehydratase family protein, partial [Gemmatimonadetes bacterium]|nr:NAD-dependent epimerase/dehydratase family protein [Gemmatimonadota bacterium]